MVGTQNTTRCRTSVGAHAPKLRCLADRICATDWRRNANQVGESPRLPGTAERRGEGSHIEVQPKPFNLGPRNRRLAHTLHRQRGPFIGILNLIDNIVETRGLSS